MSGLMFGCRACAESTNAEGCGNHQVVVTQPFICPVCLGTMKVPQGFYGLRDSFGGWTTNNMTPEPCRSCNNTGVVWR